MLDAMVVTKILKFLVEQSTIIHYNSFWETKLCKRFSELSDGRICVTCNRVIDFWPFGICIGHYHMIVLPRELRNLDELYPKVYFP